jgi:acylphosphatase
MAEPAEMLPTSTQLDAFLDALRRADFKIDPDQIGGAQKILLLAHAEADGGLAARRLKTMLAPIVARTPTQQSDFYRRFDGMMAGIVPTPATPVESVGDRAHAAVTTETIRTIPKRRLAFAGIVGAISAIAGGVWLLWPPPAPTPPPIPSEAGTPAAPAGVSVPVKPQPFVTATLYRRAGYEWAQAGLISLPLLLFGGWMGWRWRRRMLWLERRPGTRDADPALVRLPEKDQPLFPATELTAIAPDLRRHLRVPSRDLDVDRTIDETLEAGGSFTPMWQTVPRSPSYLFLIEKDSAHDHVAGILDRAIDRLVDERVAIERYHFRGDPRWLIGGDKGARLEPIADIAARHGDHRLVVFGGGDGFFEPLSDRLDSGVEQALTQWAPRAVLSTKPIESWSWRELALVDGGGFDLATASHSGLRALADRATAEPDRAAEMLEGVVVSMPTRPSLGRRQPQGTHAGAPRQGRKSALLICAARKPRGETDTERFAALLRDWAGFAVRVLRDPERARLIDALVELVRVKSEPDDILLIHFKGDYAPGGEGALFLESQGGVSTTEFARLLGRSSAGHQVIILDGVLSSDRGAVPRGLMWYESSPPSYSCEVIWASEGGPDRGLTGLLADAIEQDLVNAEHEEITFRMLFEAAQARANRLGPAVALRPNYFSPNDAEPSAIIATGSPGWQATHSRAAQPPSTGFDFLADAAAIFWGREVLGSGRLIAPGLVLTAGHVADLAPTRSGWRVSLVRSREASGPFEDPRHDAGLVWRGNNDLALLRVDSHLTPVINPIFASYEEVGSTVNVFACGFPTNLSRDVADFVLQGQLSVTEPLKPYQLSVSNMDRGRMVDISGAAACHLGRNQKLYVLGVVQGLGLGSSGSLLGIARLSRGFEDPEFRGVLADALRAEPSLVVIPVARRLRITGSVQGVGFREWATRTAASLELRGWVRNREDGSVEALAIGPPAFVEAFVDACREGPQGARVAEVTVAQAEDDGSAGFDALPTE